MSMQIPHEHNPATGHFVSLNGERYYVIEDVDRMPPFLVNLVSDSDHWMFVASNGGLTAGRVSPETALFPYITVDNIYDSTLHTGSRTVLRVKRGSNIQRWEPFNRELDGVYALSRNLYRNFLGNKILFEEINHDLQLCFRYQWATSDEYGFVRSAELANLAGAPVDIALIDGLLNLLPAGAPRHTQTNASYLVDAYKLNQLDPATGLAMYTLFSAISDRAEPRESLRANTVFRLGMENGVTLLSSRQLDEFRHGGDVVAETSVRGVRGAYLVNSELTLEGDRSESWQLVIGSEQSQAHCRALAEALRTPQQLAPAIVDSIAAGSRRLAGIMGAADAMQSTAEEAVFSHHYANVLYNVLRGGIPDDQYRISRAHFARHLRLFNRSVFDDCQDFLASLGEACDVSELLARATDTGNAQLVRLTMEYLPITFGRRHGDPSRPWNQFSIVLKDARGLPLLNYQGNWRDIFQNWEALLLSYPDFIESVVAKFVNASTVDGYNPYRITNEGIDWEIEDPEDPWSYIGYWGDHQIIYLLKLLELSRHYHPGKLQELLHSPLFSYANVPYRIRPFEALAADPKNTVDFDDDLARLIEERVASRGADGRLLMDAKGQVYQVTLLEKLLVPVLAKLGNLVVDGGIWMNTQRPEWNDANNALVGQGLSMVTLYYLRRFLAFFDQLAAELPGNVTLSNEVVGWLESTCASLTAFSQQLGDDPTDDSTRLQLLAELGEAASRYRAQVYASGFSGASPVGSQKIRELIDAALSLLDASIRNNRREDGLYHAYNLLNLTEEAAEVEHLYPMLEGQVAALSAGVLDPEAAAGVVETLFESSIFRADQHTFLLYPDRDVPGFLDKNRVSDADVSKIALVRAMLDKGDHRIVEPDPDGSLRFSADMVNADALKAALNDLDSDYGQAVADSSGALMGLYERVFNHRAFTGRSGGMFAFEGLGSVYWHMVSKLLLAVQENFFAAIRNHSSEDVINRLGELYYRVREGIGFNKTPSEYGAFPTDPYSHTPAHAGAQQPGMTGQVKEEVLTRLGELGLFVNDGRITFDTALLRRQEFREEDGTLEYPDTTNDWQALPIPAGSLGFTFCQVPFVYRLGESGHAITVVGNGGQTTTLDETALPVDISREIFNRAGTVARVEVVVGPDALYRPR
jgi:hypothetical protein